MLFRRKNNALTPPFSETDSPSPPSDKTVLGPGWRFKGRIYGKGEVALQGVVEGELDLQGTIRIEAQASIKGLLRAEEVRMSGGFEGHLEGRRRVTLDRTARLEGDVSTPRLQMAAGARLNGLVDMASLRHSMRSVKP
jgi:cytoskeletal protein CcmA (bactofilin family)